MRRTEELKNKRAEVVNARLQRFSASALITMLLVVCFMLQSMSSASEVLDIGYGAKSIGLGKTYTSVKGDAYGIFGNPASLRGVATGEIVSMYGQMNTDVSYTMLGYVMPTKYGKFFAGYGNNAMNGFTTTTLDAVTGRPMASSDFDFRDEMLMLGYQNCLTKQISYGLRLKYISKGAGNISGYYASGMNADAGVIFEANDRLTLGLTARNIVPGETGALKLGNGQTEDIPLTTDMGLGFKAHPKLSLYTDVSITRNIPAELKIGAEWKPIDILAIRLGGEQKNAGGNDSYINGSAGVGFNTGVFGIDYAYSYDSLIQSNSRHFVSISIKTPGVTANEVCDREEPKAAAVPLKADVVETPQPTLSEVVKEPEVVEYVVVENDWLSKIAQRYLGDMMRYPEIAELNNIEDPDLIFPGQKIRISK